MNDSTAFCHFPVMGAGRLDYAPGCSYETTDWTMDAGRVGLIHKVTGNSLVSNLIQEGKAGFGCAVVIPSTMYRLISVCEKAANGTDGVLTANHDFDIESKNRSVQIVKFLPIVFYKNEDQKFTGDSSMSVDEVWSGREFVLQKGAIIARDTWHEIKPGASHLMKVQEGKHLSKGTIDVNVADDSGGFFQVLLSPDLYEAFQAAASRGEYRNHRNSILTHALGAGLEKMANEDPEKIWDALENFQALKRELGENSWDAEDFNPHKAACAYYPHLLEISKVGNEE